MTGLQRADPPSGLWIMVTVRLTISSIPGFHRGDRGTESSQQQDLVNAALFPWPTGTGGLPKVETVSYRLSGAGMVLCCHSGEPVFECPAFRENKESGTARFMPRISLPINDIKTGPAAPHSVRPGPRGTQYRDGGGLTCSIRLHTLQAGGAGLIQAPRMSIPSAGRQA